MAAGDVKLAYATKATVVCTLTSLGNGLAWQSTVIDNTVTKYVDFLLRVKTNGIAGAINALNIYAYASLSDGVYTDGATGTDGTFTVANRLNSPQVDFVIMNAATSVPAGPYSVAAAFKGTMPSKVGFIFVNNSGAALSATAGDHVIEVEGIYRTVAQS